MFNNFKNLTNKKKLTYMVIAMVLVIVVAILTIFILGLLNSKTNKIIISPSTRTSADQQKSKAIEALNNKDKDTAKALFQSAKRQYDEIGDADNAVDTEAQLYLLEHPIVSE
jgi:flagellar basal body-associated protein FliL